MGDHYDNFYYSHYGPSHQRYDRDQPVWGELFRSIADRIAREIAPSTVLDAGCAKGFLVEALRDRGIEAYGIDVSEHAIASVREDIRPHCWAGSLSEPLPQRYGLITCIEVLEHIPVESIDSVVANLCDHTDDILMSSTPDEYADPTHLNVRPAEYWVEIFGRHGFHHDLLYDPSFIQPWAMRLRRMRDPAPRVFADYEREVQRLRTEVRERTAVILQQRDDLAEQARLVSGESGHGYESQIAQLRTEVSRLEEGLHASEARNATLSDEVAGLQALADSVTVRRALQVRERAFRLMPEGTRRYRWLQSAIHGVRRSPAAEPAPPVPDASTAAPAVATPETPAEAAPADTRYEQWIAENEPSTTELVRLRLEALTWPDRPLFSIVMPVYDAEPEWLEAAIRSVLDQSYDRWELCIADDASTAAHVRPLLERHSAEEPRIKVTFRDENGGISAASNSALALATGDMVGFLDHDDILRPHALVSMARALRAHPNAGLVYSDEDKLLPDGRRGDVFFKPDWSPDLLLTTNYMCHFSVIRRDLVERVGGLRTGFEGSQDYDLFLRTVDTGCEVRHVADVLYTWRQVAGSAALSPEAKTYAYEAGLHSLQDSLERRDVDAHVEPSPALGWYFVRYTIPRNAGVTIVIATRDRADLVRRSLQSIAETTHGRQPGILIVDTGSSDPETLAFLARVEHRVLTHPATTNHSRVVNSAVRATTTPCVMLLDEGVEALEEGWLDAMLEQAMRAEVGVVGGRLRYADRVTQHEGIATGYAGATAADVDFGGYFALGDAVRDCSAITGASMMIQRSAFDQVGGFDEGLRAAYNDVDFCLRVRAAGYRVVYTPLAGFAQRESSTRAGLDPEFDEQLFRQRWDRDGRLQDPYVSRHVETFKPLRFRVRGS